jgi:hypothetical protein
MGVSYSIATLILPCNILKHISVPLHQGCQTQCLLRAAQRGVCSGVYHMVGENHNSLSEISCSHGGEYEDGCLQGYCAV